MISSSMRKRYYISQAYLTKKKNMVVRILLNLFIKYCIYELAMRQYFLCIFACLIISGCIQDNNDMSNLTLTREWDKTFPKSDLVDHRKVTFHNRYGIELAAELDGTPEGMGPWEKLRVFTIKDKEAEDGRETHRGRARGSAEGT